VDTLASAWTSKVGARGKASPVSYNGVMYVGGSGGLYGLDPTTGAIIVQFVTGSPVVTTPAVIRGFDPQPDPPGKIFFGSADGKFFAIDSAKGALLWERSVGGPPSSPAVVRWFDSTDDRVLFGVGPTLYEYDGAGNQLWSATLEGGDISRAAIFMVDQTDDRVAVSAGGALYELDGDDGTKLWSVVPSGSELGTPSLDARGMIIHGAILVEDGDGVLCAIDRLSGAVIDKVQVGGALSGSYAIGALGAVHIVVGDSKGDVYGFDQTDEFGPPIWQAALGGPIDGPPVLANGLVFVGTDPEIGDPNLYALNAASGKVLWTSPRGGRMASEVADGKVAIAIDSGEVLEYDGPDS
jgi:eukaryotic-like serine/threonine-protein kinase